MSNASVQVRVQQRFNQIVKNVDEGGKLLASPSVLGAIGAAIIMGVTQGNMLTYPLYVNDLSVGMNKTQNDVVMSMSIERLVQFSMMWIVYFSLSLQGLPKRIMFDPWTFVFGLLCYVVGATLLIYYSKDWVKFTAFFGSFVAVGLGLMFWNALCAISSFTHPMTTSGRISAYVFAFLTPQIFSALLPVVVDLKEKYINSSGDLWEVEQSDVVLSSTLWLLAGTLLINFARRDMEDSAKNDSTLKEPPALDFKPWESWMVFFIGLSILCLQWGDFVPHVWFRPYIDNLNFTNVTVDEQILSSMMSWGGAAWQAFWGLILLFYVRYRAEVPGVGQYLVFGLIILELLGAMICLVLWRFDVVKSYAGFQGWTFMYGALASGSYMFFFLLFGALWHNKQYKDDDNKKMTIFKANYQNSVRLLAYSSALTLGSLGSFLVSKFADNLSMNDLISMSAGFMGGSLFFVLIGFGFFKKNTSSS